MSHYLEASQNLPELCEERQALVGKIKKIKQRLQFGYSEPLHDYMIDLMRQDMQVLCQISEILQAA